MVISYFIVSILINQLDLFSSPPSSPPTATIVSEFLVCFVCLYHYMICNLVLVVKMHNSLSYNLQLSYISGIKKRLVQPLYKRLYQSLLVCCYCYNYIKDIREIPNYLLIVMRVTQLWWDTIIVLLYTCRCHCFTVFPGQPNLWFITMSVHNDQQCQGQHSFLVWHELPRPVS